MKNILVTGGAGFIGAIFTYKALLRKYNVISIDNLSNSDLFSINIIKSKFKKTFSFIHGDIRDRKTLLDIFNTFEIDVVIHFAGLKSISESFSNKKMYFENNVQGTEELIKAISSSSCRRLIFSSSASVYGDVKYLPANEKHPLNPTNPYSQTKADVENLLNIYSNKNTKFSFVSLRYFNPIGSMSGLLGEFAKFPTNLIPLLINSVIQGKEFLIYGNDYETPDGTGKRDYIHVEDLAEAHLEAINFILDMYPGHEILNVGTGESFSVIEIIKSFECANNLEVKYTFKRRRAGDIAEIYACNRKITDLIKWKPRFTIKRALADAWLYYKKNPKRFEIS
jgi:UDP-glucose 4-epimerase